MELQILKPIFLILIPIIIVGLMYSTKFMRIKNRIKKIKYVVIRSIICILLVFALSEISIKWSNNVTNTIFLVDVSDSVKNNQTEVENFIRDSISKMPKNNKAGIITFGDNAIIEQIMSDKKTFTDIQTVPIQTATNFENAISTAFTMFNNETAKRIVLITDGNENDGDITKTINSIVSQNIDIEVLKLENNNSSEVYVDDLIIPDKINIGDTFQVKVKIKSNIKTTAKISLYSGTKLRNTIDVNLEIGDNQFVFKDTQNENGIKDYRVVIDAQNDTNTLNNEYVAFTQATSVPKVLVIEGKKGEGEEFQKVLSSANIDYTMSSPDKVPNNIEKLNNYKSIVLLNVNYDDLNKKFLNNVESYVKDYSGGLVAIGGDNSFALGGYKDTVLEKILPVNMDLSGEREVPKVAMIMVIDHSGSMSVQEKGNITNLDLAKQSIIGSLNNFRSTDEIGVITFDDKYSWVYYLQEANDLESVQNAVSSIKDGGGTSIYPALAEAVKSIKKSDAQIKHIILLTDGQDGYHKYGTILNELKKENITLSTVAIGQDADMKILKYLANEGNGRYYYSDVNSDLPKIFAKEVSLSAKAYLVNKEFTPVIAGNSDIISGIFDNGVPSLLGYVASTAKDTANKVLVSDDEEPILTTWQYGLGKVVAWNSDAINEWTSYFALWDNYSLFWKNIINYTISDTSLGEDTVSITQNGNKAVINYKTNEFNQDTKIYAVYTDENGESQEKLLEVVAPKEYQTEISTDKVGVYSVNIRNEVEGKIIKSANTAFGVQYSPEYRFYDGSESFDKFINETNAILINSSDEVFVKLKDVVKSRKDLYNVFLIIATIIFLLDIIIRRFNTHLIENLVEKCVVSLQRKQANENINKFKENVEFKDIKSNIDVNKEKIKEEKKVKKKLRKINDENDINNNQLDTSSLLKKKKDRNF